MSGDPFGMVKVGESIGPWPGDIWVSETLLAQIGEAKARQLVRETYRAAYAQRYRSEKDKRS